jgi:Ca-activated chloride channel family protein
VPAGVAQVTAPLMPSDSSGKASKRLTKGIHVDVEMVLVNVTVTDSEDRLVMNLQKENFQLFEDNVAQEIVSFSHEDAPVSIGLILDTSGSMANKVDSSRQAALQVLMTANPLDEFFLVSIGSEAKLRTRFTSSVEELQNRMTSIKPKGSTALLDAIHLSIKQMKTGRYRRCALVVISDGGDNHSWHSESQIRKDLKEADCQLYAMGIFDEHDMELTSEEHDGPALLSKLAEITGGRAFAVPNLDELPDIATKISMELRDQYVLGYKPGGARRGRTWRSIKVKIAPSASLPLLHVYARTGYYETNNR